MTEQEARDWLKVLGGTLNNADKRVEALALGIKALEEVQQLRNEMWELNQICRDYTSLGTVEELKEAKEKQIAKKPFHISEIDDNDNALVKCPICHANSDYSINTIKGGYCWKCGQKLDWGNEDESET